MSVSTTGTANGGATATASADFAFSGDFTIAFWIKSTQASGSNTNIMNNNPALGNWFIHYGSSGGSTAIDITATGLTGNPVGANVGDGQWHSIMIVRSGSTTTLYSDNVAAGTTGTGSGRFPQGGNDGLLRIGHSTGTGDFTGLFSRYTVFNAYAFTSGDRSTFQSFGIIPASPQANWLFASSIALNNDSSGNGHTFSPNGTGADWVFSTDEPVFNSGIVSRRALMGVGI